MSPDAEKNLFFMELHTGRIALGAGNGSDYHCTV